jgi:hypothetical protein
MKKESDYQIALRLAQGHIVAKEGIDDKQRVMVILKSFKNNCNLVIRQLKKEV